MTDTKTTHGKAWEADPSDRTLPCIVCGKILEAAMPDNSDKNQPYAGLAFHSHGHYGGTVFDSMGNELLEVNICDECLVAKACEGVVLHGCKAVTHTAWDMSKWEPEAMIDDQQPTDPGPEDEDLEADVSDHERMGPRLVVDLTHGEAKQLAECDALWDALDEMENEGGHA